MKISIVIPVYNVEPYIEDCLKSVAAQTYNGDIECIIVNDCTPDNSCVIIERFKKEYNGGFEFKLLHHAKNRGLSAARNTGIDAATGEYIYFLDSDDEITPNCIELLTTPLKNKRYDFVIGDYKTIGSDNEFPPLLLDEGEITTNDEIRTEYFKNNWYMMAWNKLCKLDFIRTHHLYFEEGIINEDELWSFQKACIAETMYISTKSTYKYKIRNNSITGCSSIEKRIESFSLITKNAKDLATRMGILYEKNVFRKILSFRELTLINIFSLESYSKKKYFYLKYYQWLRIAPLKAYKHKVINGKSLIKELYNYLPNLFGYWYLNIYNFILRR